MYLSILLLMSIWFFHIHNLIIVSKTAKNILEAVFWWAVTFTCHGCISGVKLLGCGAGRARRMLGIPVGVFWYLTVVLFWVPWEECDWILFSMLISHSDLLFLWMLQVFHKFLKKIAFFFFFLNDVVILLYFGYESNVWRWTVNIVS